MGQAVPWRGGSCKQPMSKAPTRCVLENDATPSTAGVLGTTNRPQQLPGVRLSKFIKNYSKNGNSLST